MLGLLEGENFCSLEYLDFSEESVALGKDLAAGEGLRCPKRTISGC